MIAVGQLRVNQNRGASVIPAPGIRGTPSGLMRSGIPTLDDSSDSYSYGESSEEIDIPFVTLAPSRFTRETDFPYSGESDYESELSESPESEDDLQPPPAVPVVEDPTAYKYHRHHGSFVSARFSSSNHVR